MRHALLHSGHPWKPAGKLSDKRAVASHLAVHTCEGNDFKHFDCLWVGCLFQKGCLFKNREDGTFWLSLGYFHRTVIAWKVEPVSADFFMVTDPRQSPSIAEMLQRLKPLCIDIVRRPDDEMEEKYQGIPCEPSCLVVKYGTVVLLFSVLSKLKL